MTRLKEDWISHMDNPYMEGYNSYLIDKTGLDLLSLTAIACEIPLDILKEKLESVKIAAVPITSGEGTISGFSGTVVSIIKSMGGSCFETEACDVDGFYKAVCGGAEIIFAADDNRFLAVNIKSGLIGENNIATALGYVAALEAMAGGKGSLSGKKVLLLGCGPVGRLCGDVLIKKKARVTVYDKFPNKAVAMVEAGLAHEALNSTETAVPEKIADFKLIVDATNEGPWLPASALAEGSLIAAPGIPLSIYGDIDSGDIKIVHDMLQIGTAVMLGQALIRGADRMDHIDSKSM